MRDAKDNLKVKVNEALDKALCASYQECRMSNNIGGAPAVMSPENGHFGEGFRNVPL